MTLKELRNKIAESDNAEFLNSVSVAINYPHINFSASLNGLANIYQFVLGQVKGWNEFENLPSELNESKRFFENIKQQIQGLETYFSKENESNFRYTWNQIKDLLEQERSLSRNEKLFIYNSPEVAFLVSLFLKEPNWILGAQDYISLKHLNNISDRNYLNGFLQAYEFKNQDSTDILQRRNHEKKSLSTIRKQFQEHVSEAELHLNDYLKRTQDNLTEHFNTVDELKNEKDKSFEDWFKTTQEEFTNFFDIAQQNITENENLYTEKLRLKAPAQYWKERALKLKKESNTYMYWLIGVSLVSALLLFILLMSLGNGFFETAFSDTVKGIKWSIILITLVSILAFSIKLLAKMTFSSLHLSRDAEEREQLTHFYLALKHDTSVSDNDRQLILQSLFSRSDTGLLREDSAPTMPNSMVEKIVNGKP